MPIASEQRLLSNAFLWITGHRNGRTLSGAVPFCTFGSGSDDADTTGQHMREELIGERRCARLVANVMVCRQPVQSRLGVVCDTMMVLSW